ncbi:cytochrome P450 [Hygrophoropsis aurantiaca]|uniref:Cytochrome P450 n=1 Tax=Hygrophoropsis aurantiaca TaxID=72124 RepID=A0ACB7ZZQ5_9AGAM|nr:cytochrome P450 [Hygrophoropsis aurantiaca]
MVWKLTLGAAALSLMFGLWKLIPLIIHRFTSPLRNLPGPKCSKWIYGNVFEIISADKPVFDEWLKEHGQTFRFRSFLGAHALFTMDTRALNHILTHSNDYQKPEHTRYRLTRMLGKGMGSLSEQRRIMNPAFGPAQIQGLTSVFFEKSIKLRDAWISGLIQDEAGNPKRVDVMPWLSRLTLDVIGLAGLWFNYEFGALDVTEKPNELSEAFGAMVAANQSVDTLPFLQTFIPALRSLPTDRGRRIVKSREIMNRIGRQLLRDAKAAVFASQEAKNSSIVQKTSVQGRDLLSLLVRANMATDLPESQKLSDEDVLAQVPTFLVAGHETTSTATTWALYALSLAPNIQSTLREELLSVDTDTPPMDELMALPYLDAVVRETLRVHAPIPNSLRVAMKDDVIPLENPFVDKNGKLQHNIKISKGDPVLIPILAINRSAVIWGPDAKEFKPERWKSVPEVASRSPGIRGHFMTFLDGPRACIAHRFSLVEMKAILFTLIRAFEFELGVPENEIDMTTRTVRRPHVRSEPEKRYQLPLLIKPYQRP